MTDHTKSAGEVEARDTLRSEIAHIVASTVAGTCCRKTGGKGGDNGRPDCECLAASSDIMMKLDAYLAKLTSTKSQDPRVASEIAKRAYDKIAAFGWDISWKNTNSIPDDAWPIDIIAKAILERESALSARIKGLEEERETWAKKWSDKRDDCDTATQEVERLQSDKDRLTKALEEIAATGNRTFLPEVFGRDETEGVVLTPDGHLICRRVARRALSPPSTSQSEGEG